MNEVNLFRKFVDEMDLLLRENDEVNGKSQRQLLNELFDAERAFKALLLSSKAGHDTYARFMEFILNDKKNKLSVRPYFRERQNTFSKKVFPILKAKDPQRLHRFRINYLFAKWVLSYDDNGKPHYTGRNRRRLEDIYESILNRRDMLCENNLPLAIHWAKRFWTKVPQVNLEYMDLIQDSSKGLLEAIDNFVPPYKTVFRSTAIGRMGLNMSEDYSATLLKMSPKDRRILYRIRMARKHNENITMEELVKFVTESFKGVTAEYIIELEAATRTSSMDYAPAGVKPLSDTLPDSQTAEDSVERAELHSKLNVLLEKLKTIEKKVLLMKHGEMYGLFPDND